ncbi:MAG: hypothetical protein AAF665_09355 [Pseudomonadota bacterium]
MFEMLRHYINRHAQERRLNAEMSRITESELLDLNLSRAKLAELSHRQVWG